MADIVVSSAVDTFLRAADEEEMRAALELGDGATADNVVLDDDSRLTNARTPTAHATSHVSGSDQIAVATTSIKGLMSASDKTKLDGLSNYTLPAPTTTVLGGVKRNAGTEGQFVTGIDSSGALEYGTPDASGFELPKPTTTTLGGVMRNTGSAGQFVSGINSDGELTYSTPSGGGDVAGPASSVNNRVAVFDGTDGKKIKDSGSVVSDFAVVSRNISTANSLTGGGNLSADRTLSLVGDSGSPGNSKYYGTNGSGTRGFYDLPTVSVSFSTVATMGSSRSLELTDVGKYLRVTSGITITVPNDASVSWPSGSEIYFRKATSSSITLSTGLGVSVNNSGAVSSLAEHDTFALKKIAADTWDLI